MNAVESAVAAEAGTDGEAIVLPCSWPEGMAVSYDHVRQRTDTRTPALAEVKTTTPVTVRVVSSGVEAGVVTVFDYEMGDPVVDGPPEVVEATEALLGGGSLPTLRLRMEDGSLTGVQNHLEVIDELEGMLRATTPPDAPPEVLEKTLAMFRDPNMGPRLLLRDVANLFAMHCVTMTPGQVVEAPVQYPNPFGGAPIDGYSRVELAAYDADTQQVTITTEDSMSPEAVKALVPDMMKAFDVGDLPEDAMAQFPPIQSSTVGTMVYAVEDGMPVHVEVTRTVGADGHPQRKSDTWIWDRVAE